MSSYNRQICEPWPSLRQMNHKLAQFLFHVFISAWALLHRKKNHLNVQMVLLLLWLFIQWHSSWYGTYCNGTKLQVNWYWHNSDKVLVNGCVKIIVSLSSSELSSMCFLINFIKCLKLAYSWYNSHISPWLLSYQQYPFSVHIPEPLI